MAGNEPASTRSLTGTQGGPRAGGPFGPASAYEAWYRTRLGRFVDRVELRTALTLLQASASSRILDVGCGTGHFQRRIAEQAGACIGLDASPEMLASAAQVGRGRNLEYVLGKAEALPFVDHSFDGLLCMTTLEFVESVEAAIMEARRVVRPGGRLVFGVLNSRSSWAKERKKRGGLWSAARFFDREELQALLAPYGRVHMVCEIHVPRRFGWLPAPLMPLVDRVARHVAPWSGALLAAQLTRLEEQP